MTVPYNKPFRDVDEGVELLKRRGLAIADEVYAKRCLERVGYYRLSAYWYPFRVIESDSDGPSKPRRADRFIDGATFDDVMAFYLFDKRMRLLMSDALERIEIAIRAALTETLGALGPHAHRDPRSYSAKFTTPDENGRTDLAAFLSGDDQGFRKSQEEFAKHFRENYAGKPPIWIAAQAWDWGRLAHTIKFLSNRNKDAVCHRVHPELSRAKFISWITCLNDVRNTCFHHSRLWNKPLINSPSFKAPKLELFDEFRNEHGKVSDSQSKRLFGAVAVTVFLMRTIHPQTQWPSRFRDVVRDEGAALPKIVGPEAAGFPRGWEDFSLWRLSKPESWLHRTRSRLCVRSQRTKILR